MKGDIVYMIRNLHDQYGSIVRLGPDQLSYTSPEAWRTIYGQRSNEMPKSARGHGHTPPPNLAHTLLTAPTKQQHSEQRRALSHAFTEGTLRAQERYFQDHVSKLISKLSEIARNDGGPVDIVTCYNATTSDTIGGWSSSTSAVQ
jgi:cytochrome P450